MTSQENKHLNSVKAFLDQFVRHYSDLSYEVSNKLDITPEDNQTDFVVSFYNGLLDTRGSVILRGDDFGYIYIYDDCDDEWIHTDDHHLSEWIRNRKRLFFAEGIGVSVNQESPSFYANGLWPVNNISVVPPAKEYMIHFDTADIHKDTMAYTLIRKQDDKLIIDHGNFSGIEAAIKQLRGLDFKPLSMLLTKADALPIIRMYKNKSTIKRLRLFPIKKHKRTKSLHS